MTTVKRMIESLMVAASAMQTAVMLKTPIPKIRPLLHPSRLSSGLRVIGKLHVAFTTRVELSLLLEMSYVGLADRL